MQIIIQGLKTPASFSLINSLAHICCVISIFHDYCCCTDCIVRLCAGAKATCVEFILCACVCVCTQICSLMRGGIAERGGVRVGHRIIEINGQSVVATAHEKIVQALSNSVGEVRINCCFRLACLDCVSCWTTSFKFWHTTDSKNLHTF